MIYETTLTRARADHYRAEGWWADTLLHDAVRAAVDRHPHKTALIDARGRRTYGELLKQVDKCALGLLDLGIPPRRRGAGAITELE